MLSSDNFDRPDSTNLGGNWIEQAQDWSIDTNELKIAAAGAVATWAAAHSDTDVRVFVRVKGTTTSDLARIILNFTDTDNYYFAEIKFASPGYLKLYDRAGGTDTELATVSLSLGINTFFDFAACMKNGALFARVGGTAGVAKHGLSPTSGTYGLGTGGTVAGTIRFDDFHSTDADKAECPQCLPPCECTGDVPDEVTVVVSGITNGTCSECSSLDGTYILQRCGVGAISADQCTWDLIIGGVCSPDPYNQVRVGIGKDGNALPYYRFVSFRGAVRVDGVPTECKFGGQAPFAVVFTNRFSTPQPCPDAVPETINYLGDPAPTVCLGDSATVTLASA